MLTLNLFAVLLSSCTQIAKTAKYYLNFQSIIPSFSFFSHSMPVTKTNNEFRYSFNWTHGNSSSQSINFEAVHTRYHHLGVDSIRRENAVRSEAKASLTVSVTFQSRCCEIFEKQIWRCIRVATGKSMRQILQILMRQIIAGGSERKRKGKQGKEKEHEHKEKAEGHEQNEPMWVRQQK